KDLGIKDAQKLEALKEARISKVFEAADKAPVPETKIDSITGPIHEKGWEPDPRIKLVPKEDLPYAREVLMDDLKAFEGGTQTHKFELYRELMNTNWLTDAQKIRLTDVVCQVRDYYAHLNTAENPNAFKAQRSWALSQASIAEVIDNALVEAGKGVTPESA